MKLICCDIEGFGTLKNVHMDFRDGLHVLKAPNGSGKTTLAVFLKAMLFGLGRGSRTALSKNERKKYRPWQGGAYGGSLTLELGGRQYRITRSFGETAAQDRFRLVDLETGRPSADYSSDLGREIFRLDESSFSRSTYVPQRREGDSLSTEQIHRRLTELVQDTESENSFDAAMKRLQARRMQYRHYRGEGGSIHALRGEIHDLSMQLANAEEDRTREAALGEEIRELANRRRELTAQLSQLRASVSQAEALGRARAVRELENTYPKGFPTSLDQFLEAKRQRSLLQARLEATALSGEEIRRFQGLSALSGEEIRRETALARQRGEEIALLEAAPRRSRVPGWSLTALSAAALAAGAFVLALVSPLYGLMAMGAGALGVTIGLVLLLRRDPRQTALAALRTAQAAFLSQFGPGATVDRVERNLEEYDRLARRSRSQQALEGKIRTLSDDLDAFCREYCPHGDLNRMALDRERYRALGPAPEELEDSPGEDAAALRRREAALARELDLTEERLLSKRQQRLGLTEALGKLPALEGKLEDLRRELRRQERSCSLLDAAMELLTQARENLARQYLAPVEARFSHYVNQLGMEPGRIRLEGDLVPALEREGEQRKTAWFSAGQGDLLTLAMHLALVDVLFPGEQPFLILDDPFVNLDDDHTARGLALLEAMSRERQVIYLTCHSGRTV